MASIDERVVAMSFENAKFEAGVSKTMGTLGKLDSSIRNIGKTSGLDQVQGSLDRVSFTGLHRAIDGITGHFGTMQVAVGVILGNLATTAIQKLGSIGKALALDPVTQGFQEYATNLNSIQTILANTQDSGGNLKTVNAALQDLNRYSDKTIYNFGQMAKNIGTFTAAGVQLKPATESIKGIANLAALSGSNADQASSAMYQLSQAIAAGKVNLQDWNSVVNSGMGGAVFQKALIRTGQNMGTIAKGVVEIDKKTGHATINGETFRESLQVKPGEKSWLTSDVLVKTLGQFTGDLTDAQLKAQGFNQEQIAAIQRTAKTAKLAATEVKTLSGVFDVVKESIGSGWSSTFQIIFGNFNESKKTFTDLSNFLNRFVSRTFNAFDGVLKQWKKLGGRTVLIRGIKIAFDDLMRILRPIHNAFRDIFPSKTGKDLFEMTKNFTKLMNALKPSDATIKELRRIFRGIFAVFHIGIGIIKGVAGVFTDLFKSVGAGSGGFLNFAANIGDFLVKLDKTLTKGGALNRFFKSLEDNLKKPLEILKKVAAAIAGLFGVGDTSGIDDFSNSIGGLNKKLDPFAKLIDIVKKAWEGFTDILGKVKDSMGPMLDAIGKVVANFGSVVANSIKNADYSAVFAAVNTVLLGGILLIIKKFFGKGMKVDFGGGILKNISATFETLTGNLKSMQRQIQAKTILEIAAALAVLAIAVIILSTIDPKKLATAMSALAVGIGELVTAMVLLDKGSGKAATIKMPGIAAALILLAGAMILLAIAAKIFATMSWQDIEKGLTAVGGMLAAIGAATQLMNPIKMAAAGIAMLPIAIALVILAGAVKLFSKMSWKDIAKGLVGIGGALLAIGIALQTFPPSAILMGPSLVLIAVALNMIAGAIKIFSSMDPKTLAIGIGAIAGALIAIGLAIDTIPPTLALQAVGLVILAGALTALSGVVAILGNMDMQTLERGIIAMGAALVVLAVGLTAMQGTLPGAIALVAAAAAFSVLAPALALMGSLSWDTILHGLAAMAAVLAVLAIAGLIAGPALVALGLGLLAIGAGVALIGAGIYLFAKGLSLLSDTAVKAFAALLAAAALFIAAFPQLLINFVKGIVETLDGIVKLAPKIVKGLITILELLLDAIIKLAPKAADAIIVLIEAILKVLDAESEPLIKAGYKLLNNLLQGLADNIGPITDRVASIIANFLNALANRLPEIINAGLNLLNNFLTGITSGIPRLAKTVAHLIATFIISIANHIPEILDAAGTLINRFITGLANQLPKIIAAGISIITNLLTGIQQSIPKLVTKALDVAKTFVTNIATGLVKLVGIGAQGIIDFLNGLATEIRKKEPQIIAAGYNVATAIGDGMVQGLKDIAPKLLKRVRKIASDMIDAATSIFDIGSPSKVFRDIGKNVMDGLHNGIRDNAGRVDDAIKKSVKNNIKTAKSEIAKMPDMAIDANPVIKPILDLSHVRKHAPQLQGLLDAAPLSVAVSARHAASSIAAHQEKQVRDVQTGPIQTIHFEQHNTSPEPLSNIEIYRQTNNQISRAKNMLAKA